MAVASGIDYALAKKIAWAFPELGPGNGVAVVTAKNVYILPTKGIEEDFKIEGRHPLVVVQELLQASGTDLTSMNDALEKWTSGLKGIIKPMSAVKRIKIKTGFFMRMVGFSEKDTGFDSGFGTALSIRPTKDEMQAFINFFKEDRRVMV